MAPSPTASRWLPQGGYGRAAGHPLHLAGTVLESLVLHSFQSGTEDSGSPCKHTYACELCV